MLGADEGKVTRQNLDPSAFVVYQGQDPFTEFASLSRTRKKNCRSSRRRWRRDGWCDFTRSCLYWEGRYICEYWGKSAEVSEQSLICQSSYVIRILIDFRSRRTTIYSILEHCQQSYHPVTLVLTGKSLELFRKLLENHCHMMIWNNCAIEYQR